MASSVRGFYTYIRFIKVARNAGRLCGVGRNKKPDLEEYASRAILSLMGVSSAHAAPYCEQELINLVQEIASNTARYGDEASDIARLVTEHIVAMDDIAKISIEHARMIERIVESGNSSSFAAFLDNIKNKRLGNLDASSNGFGRTVEGGDTVMDEFLSKIGSIPYEAQGRAQFLYRLKDRNEYWIRGMYGEAALLQDAMKQYSTIRPETINVNDRVIIKNRAGDDIEVFGVDFEAELEDGRMLFSESKVLGKNYSDLKGLEVQFKKHLETKIEPLLIEGKDGLEFSNGKVPLFYYGVRGSFARLGSLKKRLVSLCKDNTKIVLAGFDFDSIFSDAPSGTIPPLVN